MQKSMLFCLVCSAAVASAQLASAASVTYVGTQANIQKYRSTSVAKTFDADGDNVYGTAGYIFYGLQTSGNNGGGVDFTDPLTYNQNGFQTVANLPSSITLANHNPDGQNSIARGFGYTQIDDPRGTPSANVGTLQAGFADDEHGRNQTLLDITLGANTPASGYRVGLYVANDGGGDSPDTVTLGSTTLNLSGTGGGFDAFFFDVAPTTPGVAETISLSESKVDSKANGNVVYYGLTFDAVPEPTSLALIGVGGLFGLRRRSRR